MAKTTQLQQDLRSHTLTTPQNNKKQQLTTFRSQQRIRSMAADKDPESATYSCTTERSDISPAHTIDDEIRTLLVMHHLNRTNRARSGVVASAYRQAIASNDIGLESITGPSIPPPQRFARRARPIASLPAGPSKALMTPSPSCDGMSKDSLQTAPKPEGPMDERDRLINFEEMSFTFEAINRYDSFE